MQNGFLVGEDTTCFERKVEDLLDRNLFDIVVTTRFLNGGDSAYEHFFIWGGMMCEPENRLFQQVLLGIQIIVLISIFIFNSQHTLNQHVKQSIENS